MEETLETYVQADSIQRRDALDVIEEFSDQINQMRGNCIDIGCGPGTVTKELLMPKLPSNSFLHGGDISRRMIEFARSKYSEEERLFFLHFDVESNEVPSNLINTYDNAVSFYCLHWCQKIRTVFDNFYKILRPGGKALVLFLADNNGFDGYLQLHDRPEYKPYMEDVTKYIPYFHRCNNARAKLKKILEESGFKVLHCSYREKTFVFKNRQDLRKHILAVNPFIHRMPKVLRKQFEDDLVDEIVSRKISFANSDNETKDECKILDRYHVLIAYFKKPNN